VSLSDCKRGDELAVLIGGTNRVEKTSVVRVNPKTLTDQRGRKWDKRTGREWQDPGYGYATTVEPWDPERHPYAEKAAETRRLVRLLDDAVRKATPRQIAEAQEAVLDVFYRLGCQAP
jgi:hypothetical protein